MDDIEDAERYLQFHQIHKIWEKLTHLLVINKPDDVPSFILSRLREMKKEREQPGRHVVFLLGAAGSDVGEVAFKLQRDLGVFTLEASEIFGEDAASVSDEEIVVSLGSRIDCEPKGSVFVVHGFPRTLRQALVFQAQVAPIEECIYLKSSSVHLSEKTGAELSAVEHEIASFVHPLAEFFSAKGTLQEVDTSRGDFYDGIRDHIEELKKKAVEEGVSSLLAS
eukprot:Sspe_Gene.112912::Locus_96785_Transcript_1_1_Confidence_1.000_Length_774::g.112912::m.112912